MDSRNESMFLRISYTNPATLFFSYWPFVTVIVLQVFWLRSIYFDFRRSYNSQQMCLFLWNHIWISIFKLFILCLSTKYLNRKNWTYLQFCQFETWSFDGGLKKIKELTLKMFGFLNDLVFLLVWHWGFVSYLILCLTNDRRILYQTKKYFEVVLFEGFNFKKKTTRFSAYFLYLTKLYL